MFDLVAFIPRAIMQGMPLLFGCTGNEIRIGQHPRTLRSHNRAKRQGLEL